MKRFGYKLIVLLTLITILIILSGINVFAQESNEYKFEQVVAFDNELSTAFIQDSDGFFWIGANGALIKYNGYETVLYQKGEDSLSGNTITALLEDDEGLIWIGTFGEGFNSYDKKTDTFTYYKNDPEDENSLSYNAIDWSSNAIIQDSGGYIWIGTQNGLNKYDKKTDTFTRYFHNPDDPNSLTSNKILAVCEDSEGYIWIGTQDGLNKYDKKTDTFTRYFHNPDDLRSVASNLNRDIIIDKEGKVWIGGFGGISLYNKETDDFTQYTKEDGLGFPTIYAMTETSQNQIWCSHGIGSDVGISILNKDTGTFTVLSHDPTDPTTIPGSYISTIYEDNTGIIWIVSGLGIISKYDKQSQKIELFNKNITNPNDPYSLKDNPIIPIYEGSKGYIWLGSGTSGLHRFDPKTKKFKKYLYDPENPELFPHPYNPCIYEDSENNFWVTSYLGGLSLFDRDTGKVIKTYHPNPDVPGGMPMNTQIRAIVEDSQNPDILWMGAHEYGLIKFNKKTENFEGFSTDPDDPDKMSNYWIYDIHEEVDSVWVPTQYGLNVFNKETETFTHYFHNPDDPKSLGSNQLFGIFIDSKDRMWISTGSGGLNLFDRENDTFTHYDLKTGFPTNDVRTVIEDDKGYLWIGTGDSGIVKYNPDTQETKVYTKSDNLQGNAFFESAVLKSSRGYLWFGGMNGANRFDPDKLKDNQYIPPVYLTSLTQGGEYMKLSKAPERLEELELDWNNNFFEFEFAALNYTKPEKNRFAYMLKGLEDDWFYSGNRRFGRYTGLNEGMYILKMKGSNNDGLWNEEGAELKIYVKPKTNITPRTFKLSDMDSGSEINIKQSENSFTLEVLPLDYSLLDMDFSYKLEPYDQEWIKGGNRRFVHYKNLKVGNYLFKTNNPDKLIKININPPFWQTWWFIVLTVIISLLFIVLVLVIIFVLRTRSIRKQNERLERTVKERTSELKKANAQMKDELVMAQKVQRGLIPDESTFPQTPKLRFSAEYVALDNIGGDLYDVIKLSDVYYGFLIADAAGHGVPAALISTMAKVTFSNKSYKYVEGKDTGAIVTEVNKEMYHLIKDTDYDLTAFYGVLNTDNGEFEYTNAAHHPAILYKNKTKELLSLDTPDTYIGLVNDIDFHKGQVGLENGDLLILFTDGIVEATNYNDEMYDTDRLYNYIKDNISLSIKELAKGIIEDVKRFTENKPISDDMAVLCIKIEKV